MRDGVFHERFSVEQFRAASFEVKAPQPAREPIAGEPLKLTSEARYLYGAPLAAARSTGACTAGAPRQLSDAAGVRRSRTRASGSAGTDSRSAATEPVIGETSAPGQERPRQAVADAEEGPDFHSAQDFMVSAGSTRDASDDRRRTSPSRTSGGRLLRPRSRQPDWRGEGRRAASSWSRSTRRQIGSPRTARFTVLHHDWTCAWEAWGYRGQLPLREEAGELMRQGDQLAAQAPAELNSRRRARASTAHRRGHGRRRQPAAAASEIYSWGDGEGFWQRDDNERLT